MKIFLIGMPGSGKTTLGKAVASQLMIDFVDLDAEIENAEQKSIADIFSQQGEAHFRMIEARLLREWAASAKGFVMATGGGAPCYHQGMKVINESGVSIFLDWPVAALIDRVRKNRERPLLLASNKEELRKKLDAIRRSRLDCYRQAKVVLSRPTLNAVLECIRAKK